jgi:hypothetical protein
MAAKATNSVSLHAGPIARTHIGAVVTQVFANTTAIDLVATDKIPDGTAVARFYCQAQALTHYGSGASAAATGFPLCAADTASQLIDLANTDHFWVAPAAAATIVIELHESQPA